MARLYRGAGASGGIDDSLFASSKPAASRQMPANAAVISRGELARIRGLSKITTAGDVERDRAVAEALRAEKHQAARLRKEKMLELEANAKAKSRKSDVELEREARKAAIRLMANKEIDANLDLVKMLNTLGARARRRSG